MGATQSPKLGVFQGGRSAERLLLASSSPLFLEPSHATGVSARMDHLSPEQRQTLQDQLLEEQKRILTQLAPHWTRLPLPEGEPRDLSDMATEDELRMLMHGLDHRQQKRLFEIASALVRFRDGVFGICEESDEDIPYARLELDPTVRRTAECQEEFEEEQARAQRLARDSGGQAY